MNNPEDREKLMAKVNRFFASPDRKYKQNIQKLEDEKQQAISNCEIERKEREKREEEIQIMKLKYSVKLRLYMIISIYVILTIILTIITDKFGLKENLFLKILEAWPFYLALIALLGLAFKFVIGKARLKALGRPFTKIFKE